MIFLSHDIFSLSQTPDKVGEVGEVQGVSKKTLFNKIGTPRGPKTTHGVGDHSKMLSNTLYWSDVPIFITFMDFHFPNFGPKYGPFKQNKVHC